VTEAAEQILAAIEVWRAEEGRPLVVAIDGHGAAGKTTIAAEVAFELEALVLHTDDHFHEADEAAEPRPMAQYYDWQQLRDEQLVPAILRLRQQPTSWTGALVILVEGVSSAAPALADLIDRTVFVRTPEPMRLERLHGRISEEEWDEEWLYAERLYFASRPPDSFDLVVSGAS
jgi:uridine kinase